MMHDSVPATGGYQRWPYLDPSGGDLPCSTLPRFLCGTASLAAGRGLGGAGDVLCLVAGERHLSGVVEILPRVAGRVGPRLSRRCPLPRCWWGGTSAEPAVSSASLLAPWGLGGAGPRRRQRSGDSSESALSSASSSVSPNSASPASSPSLLASL